MAKAGDVALFGSNWYSTNRVAVARIPAPLALKDCLSEESSPGPIARQPYTNAGSLVRPSLKRHLEFII